MVRAATRLLSGSALRVVTLAAHILVSFFLTPFILFAVGERWNGMWVLVASFVGYYNILDLGLTQACQRYLALALGKKDEKDFNEVFMTSQVLFTGIAILPLVFSGIVAAAAGWQFSDPEEVKVFRVLVMSLGANLSVLMFFAPSGAVVLSSLRFDLNSYIMLAKLVVRTALTVWLINIGYGVMVLGIIALGVNTVGHLYTAYLARVIAPWLEISLRHFRRDRVRELFGFGFKSFVIRIMDLLCFHVDALVIANLINLSTVTYYSMASKLCDYFRQLTFTTFGVVAPVFTQYHGAEDRKGLRDRYLMVMRFSVLLSTLMAGGIIVFGRAFLMRWVGDDFEVSYLPLVILMSSILFAMMHGPSGHFLSAINKLNIYAWVTTFEGLLNLVLSLILAPTYGMIGVAFGTSIPFWISRIFILPAYVCRHIEYPVRSYYWQLGKIFFLCCLGQAPIAVFVWKMDLDTFTEIFLYGGVYYGVYGLVAFRLFLPDADRDYFLDAMPILRKIPLPLGSRKKKETVG
jgi:O-antigen/teichoic acid export membrane protein